jgi:DNA-binding response OmpR family regulator
MAEGDELLIVDANTGHQKGMRRLFEQSGYVCTATASLADARELLESKYFPAALVDLDLERSGGGLDLLRFIREQSKATSVIMLAGRRSFEGAVEALRLGAEDVVLKQSDQVPQLRSSVALACDRAHTGAGSAGSVLAEVQGVMDEAFRVMLELAQHVYHDVSVGALEGFRPRVLIIDGDQEFLQQLAERLGDKDWDIAVEMSGGAGLDKAGDQPFELVAARDELMDLKGTMVVKTVQADRAETVGLVYSSGADGGRIERYEHGSTSQVERPFEGLEHLVGRLEQEVDRLASTQRDRRVLQAFRADHEDFFRRFGELKLRISRLAS